ncbi:TrmB family transcriptional regulator [Halohasta litorea]|uniref:TrmB family transcriptional regulator n=1 Tax=Halohasta litorea TaxID=869891 RepID=A0ABD6D3E1_9EURY|nr:TrmB family transcriptional regulator sugar-binding domain-containing protein [Halohasta litorea]MEA1930086.1 TrmB family transcriptional regulator sugar-binding domain-containing protein [Euryarchaeota archaeon]
MDDATLRAHLRRFGLSEKEVDTYLTLLEHGEATASTIADVAGVSKRYVYSVSETLEDRGFVEVTDHVVPTTIRALPPDQVVDELVRDAEAMRPALESRHTRTEPSTDSFEIVKSRVTVLKRVRSFIDGADEELTLSVPLDVLDEVEGALRAARDRGVLIVLLVSGTDELPAELADLASVTRVWSETMPTMLTVDRRVGVIAPIEMVSSAHSDTQAIVFAQQHLGPVVVASFFGNYWPVAREAAVADPVELPSSHENFWHSIFQATLWLRADADLRATIEGRTTADNEYVELDCRVVDVTQGLVEPTNNSFPVEHSLTVEADGESYTVGGYGAFLETIEADRVWLTLDD